MLVEHKFTFYGGNTLVFTEDTSHELISQVYSFCDSFLSGPKLEHLAKMCLGELISWGRVSDPVAALKDEHGNLLNGECGLTLKSCDCPAHMLEYTSYERKNLN